MPFTNPHSTGGSIAVLDEGVQISSAASSFNYVGAGITATSVGNAITVTVPGGGSATLTSEAANETPDGVITTFTFPHSVGVIFLNGVAQFVGGNLASVVTTTAVFNTAPLAGDEIKNGYAS